MYIKVEDDGFKLLPTSNILEPIRFKVEAIKRDNTLFETIKIEDGDIINLEYHQQRVDFAFKNLYRSIDSIKLHDILDKRPKNGLYRAKVVYGKNGLIDCSFYIYNRKVIKTIGLIEVPELIYNYKYSNREMFKKLKDKFYEFDELLVTKNGFLTDTTIANIALLNEGNYWHTPKNALLNGTVRQRYIDLNRLIEKMIHFHDLKNYSKIATLNAMVDFNILKG